MPFEARVVDVSVYQGTIDWAKVKAAGIYAAVIRAGYGRYAKQEDLRFAENYAGAQAAGLPTGIYWFSYANTPEEAVLEAQICLQVLAGRELQMPLYFDQEEASIPAANRTACAVAFLNYIRAHSSYVPGYYSYTAYFASVDISTIQAHADTIWLADYRANYNKDIPRDMHQYTSSGTVAGITGRVDCNNLFRDFPGEISKEDKPMSFEPITGKVLRCTSAENPKCETFNSADINDSLGVLELDKTYTITARGGTSQQAGMTGTWYKIIVAGAQVFCLELPDGRCVVEDAPAVETPAVDLTEVLAALARIEATQATHGKQLAELRSGNNLIQDKLTAAGAALAE